MGIAQLKRNFLCYIAMLIALYWLMNRNSNKEDSGIWNKAPRAVITYSSHQLNPHFTEPQATAENLYLSGNYTSRKYYPMYYKDKGIEDFKWNLAAYFVTGEIARRYNATHIIDIGCGTATKLSKFQSEFQLIGVDYGSNLLEAKRSYPFIHAINLNLDSKQVCQLDIPNDVLSRAVIVSADVIEHLRNPLKCYIKVLKVKSYLFI